MPPGHRGSIAPILIRWPIQAPETPTGIPGAESAPRATEADGNPQLQVRREDPPACPLCGAPTLLSAQVPRCFAGDNGFTVTGVLDVVLCPACDHSDAGRALVRFFQVHPLVTADTTQHLADLLRAWVADVETRTVDLDQLDHEYEAWRRGDL